MMALQTNIKDQLGSEDVVFQQGFWDYAEAVGLIQRPLRHRNNDVGTGFILGHHINGILGTSALGAGTYDTAGVVDRVVNYNNTFVERFRNTIFEDPSTTADWDTTNFTLDFGAGTAQAVTELVAHDPPKEFSTASLSASASVGEVSDITFRICFNPLFPWESSTIQNGVIAYYPLDNTLYDYGGTYDLTAIDGPSFSTDRYTRSNTAIDLNGSSQYMKCAAFADLANTDSWTISAWVKPDAVGSGEEEIVSLGEGVARLYRNTTLLYYQEGTGSISVSGVFGAGTWVHITLVRTPTAVTLYKNGVAQTNIGSTVLDTEPTGTLYVGIRESMSTTYCWDGKIDEVTVWNRAITAAEALEVYNNHNPVFDTCVGYWKMNGTANDLSPYRHNGTASGASLTVDRNSLLNNAYSFDGVDDYIEVADTSRMRMTKGGTVCAWVKPLQILAPTNLVAHYKFNDDALDSSGNGYNLSWTGAAVYTASQLTKAAEDDGSKYLSNTSFYDFASNGTWTFCAWVYPHEITAQNTIISNKNVPLDVGITFYIANNGKIAYAEAGTGVSSSNGAMTINSWNHVMVTRDASANVVIYVNNISVASGTVTAINPGTTFFVGTDWDLGAGTRLDGLIDDVRVYSTVLTSAERLIVYPDPVGTESDGDITGYSGRIIDKGTDANATAGYTLYTGASDTTLNFKVNAGTVTTSTAAPLALSTWSSVIVTFDNTGRKIYVNNVDVTSTGGSEVGLPPDTAGVVRLGNRATATTTPFYGLMSRVILFDRVLSATERSQYHNSETLETIVPGTQKVSANPSSRGIQLYMSCTEAVSLNSLRMIYG